MSHPSSSGDNENGNSPQHDAKASNSLPFLGGLPHPRANSELHQDSIIDDTHISTLPDVNAKRGKSRPPPDEQAVSHTQVPQRSKRQTPHADSKPARIPPIKKVDAPHDGKLHAWGMDLDDEEITDVNTPGDIEDDNDEPFTVYDAVAGRLGYEGLVTEGRRPVSAAEYLLRHQQGPQQDQSYEQFSAHRHLKHRLPDSDLLKAIHTHASDFYGAHPDAEDSFGSMDETALIAMGILLEEFAAERLGETGDLAFVEAAHPGEVDLPKPTGRKIKRQKTKHEGRVKSERDIKAESGLSGEESSMDDRGRSSGQKRRRGDPMEVSDIATEEEAEGTDEDPSHNSEVESWISQTLLDSQGQTSSQPGTDLPIR